VISRKRKNGQSFWNVALQPIGKLGSAVRILLNRFAQLGFGLGSIRGIEYGSDICCHFSLHALARYILTGILLQVELAALPRYPAEHRFAGCLQTYVGIADESIPHRSGPAPPGFAGNPASAALARQAKRTRPGSGACLPGPLHWLAARLHPGPVHRAAPSRRWHPGTGR
jgi:hypothetical protein